MRSNRSVKPPMPIYSTVAAESGSRQPLPSDKTAAIERHLRELGKPPGKAAWHRLRG